MINTQLVRVSTQYIYVIREGCIIAISPYEITKEYLTDLTSTKQWLCCFTLKSTRTVVQFTGSENIKSLMLNNNIVQYIDSDLQ